MLQLEADLRHPEEEACERPTSRSAGSTPKWGEWLIDVPECLVLLELHEKGRVTGRRDDGEQERIRTTDLSGPFEVLHPSA
jgi:hypothetical protein